MYEAATLTQQLQAVRRHLVEDPYLASNYACGCPNDPGPRPCDAAIWAETAPHAGFTCKNIHEHVGDLDALIEAAEGEIPPTQPRV